MLAAERHAEIELALQSTRAVSTEELALQLHVSAETVRRDLILLEKQGRITRIHGGAMSASRLISEEASFAARSVGHVDAKMAIGRAGAALVRPGQSLVFDVGTTVLEVARALPPGYRGTVATCSLLVAAELAARPGVEVLIAGGRVRAGDLACSNSLTVAFFENVRADIAFLGCGGVDADAGITDFYLDEIATRRVMLANAASAFVAADATKVGVIAPHRLSDWRAPSGLITDARPTRAFRTALQDAGCELIVAER